MPLPGPGAKIDAAALTARIAGIRKDVHQVQPGAISITNATEYGLAWRADEIGAIADVARAGGMKLHMDGARFANALAFLGCAPADVSWRAGVDALRSEEHTSELQSLMRISYAVFCLNNKTIHYCE